MFISKLVCDKCGTEVSTEDKFCRECGKQKVQGKINVSDFVTAIN